MDWNLGWIGWTLVGIDLIFNIISIIYAWHLTYDKSLPRNRVDDDAVLTARAGDVDEYEIICIKLGRQEAIKVLIAKLIQKGLINIREIPQDSAESSGRFTFNKTVFEYRALEYRAASDLTPLESDVLSSLRNFKSIETATDDLAPLSLFESCKKKMCDFGLVAEKSAIEKGLESFYRVNFVMLPIMFLSLFLTGSVEEYRKILLYLSAMNSIVAIINLLILYRGKLSFNYLYPGMLPTPNLKEFIRCYEKKFGPVIGARPFEEILEWRRKGWQFRFW